MNISKGWKVAFAPNYVCKNNEFSSINDIENSGFDIIDATVPGCLETDLMNAGILPDIYFGTNIFRVQDYENYHTWYYTKFDVDETNSYLHFAGIDTISDIYLNGKLIKHTDNMMLEYDVDCDLKEKNNEIIIHIYPTCVVAREFCSDANVYGFTYNQQCLNIRKAPHMYGWDIMPRIVSNGIWKDISVFPHKTDCINDIYLDTISIDENNNAVIAVYFSLNLVNDNPRKYTVEIEGECEDSSFNIRLNCWSNYIRENHSINNCKLWFPKNYGFPYLYNVKAVLKCEDEICDIKTLKFGIRTVKLNRTDTTDEAGNGEFCFEINNKKIFILGTNWVPMDALHANDEKRLDKALELLDDIGCNGVRCWGGNVYENNKFYDFCDEHGIVVWQDFSMACAAYPQTEDFCKKIAEEAEFHIKRLRKHASVILWSGDNECDEFWKGNLKINPDNNIITRKVLPDLIKRHSIGRPYLPSSPYITGYAFENSLKTSEDHLWGPRDYFKGDFYSNSICHFVSETGYHGCPSPKSLEKFLSVTWPWKKTDGSVHEDWLAHATCPEPGDDNPYAFRIQLMADQVEVLFGSQPDNLIDFAKQSQISQAEAKKYFIERFRLSKWRRTGIMWWNLVDGWPQISDAVVDYYYVKKLAYKYIKRSQEPVCLMFDEPTDGKITLYGVNDLQDDIKINYTVKNITDNSVVTSGSAILKENSSIALESINYISKNFYYIEWQINNKIYKNHYFTDIINIDYNEYMKAIKQVGFDEFEGF